jgi:hypothetical protein
VTTLLVNVCKTIKESLNEDFGPTPVFTPVFRRE